MEYRERLPQEDINWIYERVNARHEYLNDWATYLGMSKHMFSKILHQVKALPEKYEDKWVEMETILKGEEKCETIRQKKSWKK